MQFMTDINQIVFDVDGTLTEGGIALGNDGIEMKRFSVKDGCVIGALPDIGINTAIITGRDSEAVRTRAKELNIVKLIQNRSDKDVVLKELFTRDELASTLYIGDDLNDYKAMKLCGICACPMDAAEEIKQVAHYVSRMPGGHGAVRDILEYMLRKTGQWSLVLQRYGVDVAPLDSGVAYER
jgi:3-deoxy-D-manno-octulosonate 8-phosphate phosphatase (KDO 8-P phosphatase)